MRPSSAVWWLCAAVITAPAGLVGQGSPLTLGEAVRQALARDQGVAASTFEQDAATAGIDLARQSYLPRVDALLQVNRATHNNISGLLFPQGIVSPISGPPVEQNSSSSVWGTAVGTLVTWQPFDFGARGASVRAAEQAEARGRAVVARSQLDLAATVADAYLSVLAAEETLRAAEAAMSRTSTLQSVVDALVKSEIRPGVDSATARAEHAAATMQVVLARRARDAAQALLAQYVGGSAGQALVMPGRPVLSPAAAAGTPVSHPALVERQAAADEAASRLEVARRSADPVIAVQGTVYGRGTGVLDDNSSGTGADGLGLDAYNWAVGLSVTVPFMEWHNKGARETVEELRLQAAQARREDAARELTRRLQVARQDEQASRDVAVQAEVIAEAARSVATQVSARYQAGLSSITDVADAERRLAQAEIDRALAGLATWRAHLAVVHATASGVEPFLNALP